MKKGAARRLRLAMLIFMIGGWLLPTATLALSCADLGNVSYCKYEHIGCNSGDTTVPAETCPGKCNPVAGIVQVICIKKSFVDRLLVEGEQCQGTCRQQCLANEIDKGLFGNCKTYTPTPQNCCEPKSVPAPSGTPTSTAQPLTHSPLQIIPDCARQSFDPTKSAPPPPDLNCVLLTFANIARLILGITGSLALLMFVYGGFLMITSAGESDKVTKGKTVLKNAVIGIFIIMCAGLLIQYAINTIGLNKGFEVIGQQCGEGLKGQIVTAPDGSTHCAMGCDSDPVLKGAGFKCMDASTPGAYCIAGLCTGGANNPCCRVQ